VVTGSGNTFAIEGTIPLGTDGDWFGEVTATKDHAHPSTPVRLTVYSLTDASIALSGGTSAHVGDTVSWTAAVTSVGEDPAVGDAHVTFDVPDGITLTSLSGTGWSCDLGTGCSRTLTPGEAIPPIAVTATATATGDFAVGAAVNLANDGETTNNTAQVSLAVADAQASEPTVTPQPEVTPKPEVTPHRGATDTSTGAPGTTAQPGTTAGPSTTAEPSATVEPTPAATGSAAQPGDPAAPSESETPGPTAVAGDHDNAPNGPQGWWWIVLVILAALGAAVAIGLARKRQTGP
jgi:hypothetical protein